MSGDPRQFAEITPRNLMPIGPVPLERAVPPAVRNGMPEPRLYVRRPGEAQREEWVRARIAQVRAQLAEREDR